MRAKTREKDTYFKAGIAQSLENRGKLMEKDCKSEFILLLLGSNSPSAHIPLFFLQAVT